MVTFPSDLQRLRMTRKAGMGRRPALSLLMISPQLSGYVHVTFRVNDLEEKTSGGAYSKLEAV